MAPVKADESHATDHSGVTIDQATRDAVLDWLIARTHCCHVLITGAADAVEQSLAVLTPYLDPPVGYWTPDAPLPAPETVKTLVIRNVDVLCAERQRDVSAWLEHAAIMPARVVSTTAVPLFQRVAAGLFLDVLYYRMNTVMLNGHDAPRHGVTEPEFALFTSRRSG